MFQLKCKCRHPPGDEIYRDGVVSIFEVDGRRNKASQTNVLIKAYILKHPLDLLSELVPSVQNVP